MQSAELPAYEAERLITLYGYQILDTGPEETFNELAELAAIICEAPIALVSLVDKSRQWFKARVGLESQQTARSVSFCAHAILQQGLFTVPDTLKDKRFADNPLVTGPPNIRFYAGAPLFTAEGHGLGTLCIIDRVPRKLTAMQEKTLLVLRTHLLKLMDLRKQSREQAGLARELEAFTHAVSHDLRTPLRALEGLSAALKEDYADKLDPEGRELVERIQHNAQQMDNLTRAVLYLSRIERSALAMSYVDLSMLAERAVRKLQHAAPQRDVEVIIQPGMLVIGDEHMLHILMENLLQNAWRFTAECEHAVIEVGTRKVEGKREFYVRDNGVGFEMAYVDRLFRPFQRLHPVPDEYEGSGIGLATVKRIVERHGGSVGAKSYPGEGATFSFSLPGDLCLMDKKNSDSA